MYSHQHIIIHLPAEFCSNRPIGGGDMTSYRFFNMAAMYNGQVGHVLLGSGLATGSAYEGGNLFACQISMRYLKPWLR